MNKVVLFLFNTFTKLFISVVFIVLVCVRLCPGLEIHSRVCSSPYLDDQDHLLGPVVSMWSILALPSYWTFLI